MYERRENGDMWVLSLSPEGSAEWKPLHDHMTKRLEEVVKYIAMYQGFIVTHDMTERQVCDIVDACNSFIAMVRL